jgi:pSer/pThr/pTyr-binding forkhead associated (FHA) protein
MPHKLVLEALPGQIQGPLRLVLTPEQDLSIGRTERSHLIIDHGTVTSRHARLWCEGGVWRVRDTESTAGTFVNEEAIGYGGEREIHPGDLLRLGGFRLRVGVGLQGDAPTYTGRPGAPPLPGQSGG